MTQNDYLRAFNKFLKIHGIYEKFHANVSDTCYLSYSPLSYFFHAFTWINTPEGGPFWLNFNDKWQSIVLNDRIMHNLINLPVLSDKIKIL